MSKHLIALAALLLLVGCGTPQVGTAPPSNNTTGAVRPSGTLATFTPLPEDSTAAVQPGEATPGVGTPSGPTPIADQAVVGGGQGGPTATLLPPDTTPDAATPTPTPTQTPSRPAIFAFATRPTEIEAGGQVLLAWDALGDSAFICPNTYLGLIDYLCFDVPLSGEQYVTINADERAWDYRGFTLHVSADGEQITEFTPISVLCQGEYEWWFYSSDPFATNLPEACPVTRPIQSDGASQQFERGSMLWIEGSARVVVLFDDGTYRIYTDLTQVATPAPPPAGVAPPVGAFVFLWRGEAPGSADVRARIGNPTEPETALDAAYQCYAEQGALTCFTRGPKSQIIRLLPDSTWDLWPAG
ncbi:MAG: hypothetical protein ACFB51_05075 [Anaerolineae bacterium]